MSDGINSPPYPSEATNSRSLYRHLGNLRSWVIEQQVTLRDLIPPKYTELLVEPDSLESVAFWENVSVVDKYTVFTWLRRIREGWDQLLRQHEDAWDSKYALHKRYGIVTNAMSVLQQAFIDPEQREHQNHIANAEARRQQKLIDEHLKQVLIPDELKDKVEQEPQDADDWFAEGDESDGPDNEIHG